jgi:hypothetical protein
MSDTDASARQGQSDASQNKGPAQTHNWDSTLRNEYEAAYKRQQEQNNQNK